MGKRVLFLLRVETHNFHSLPVLKVRAFLFSNNLWKKALTLWIVPAKQFFWALVYVEKLSSHLDVCTGFFLGTYVRVEVTGGLGQSGTAKSNFLSSQASLLGWELQKETLCAT